MNTMKGVSGWSALVLTFLWSVTTGFGQIKVVTNVKPVGCETHANGSVTLGVTGGTSPYSFQWSDGSEAKDLENAPRGTHWVTVTDAKGLVTRTEVVVGTYAPVLIRVSPQDATAPRQADGRLTARVTGGRPPYRYHWISFTNTETRFPPAETVHHLPEGNYLLVVQDANGCSTAVKARVNGPASARR
ncbi:MAG: SprB repeat-containing protein [Ferruginibacter sp.]|nr:SprB repeat-containing protein [Cytophagales bacterium]